MDFSLIDVLLHLDVFLDQLIGQYGVWIYAILFLVIFCETGLVVMPFLPGDSLLFLAGALAALGNLDLYALFACLGIAAVLGDSTNYWLGRHFGIRLFAKADSKIFRRQYLTMTEDFYAKHGGKTVTIARFLPIVRTFAPFVAGLGHMPYPRFLAFSVAGTVLWVGGLCTLGYLFGNLPFIRNNLTLMILAVIGLSLLPMMIGGLRHQWAKRQAH